MPVHDFDWLGWCVWADFFVLPRSFPESVVTSSATVPPRSQPTRIYCTPCFTPMTEIEIEIERDLSSCPSARATGVWSVNLGDDVHKAESAVKGLESSFRSLVSKIETHSEFEDTQLFRFFKENVPDVQDEIKWDMGRTMGAHEDGRIDEGGGVI